MPAAFFKLRPRTVTLILMLLAVMFGAAMQTNAAPAGSTAFTYQGQIVTAAGPVDGSCDLRFGLFDVETGGAPLGTGVQRLDAVPVHGGVFTVLLDFGPGTFPGAGRFLELAVRCPSGAGDIATLAPRQPLTPAPYAITSQNTQAIQQRPVAADAPATGQVLTWDGSSWRPAAVPTSAPTGTSGISGVTAGTGLSGGGTSGNVSMSLAEPYRLPQNCAASQILAWSSSGWVCANIPEYTAGYGLVLAGGAFAVDPAVFQRRVSAVCGAGTAIRTINQDGTVVCEPIPTAAAYTAGAGLQLNGTQFAADLAYLQRRVSSSCAVGSSIRAIAADGAVICEIDTDTTNPGTISGVIAGDGMTGGGITGTVTLAADTDYLQRRVEATCTPGSSIRAINVDGSVVCDAPAEAIAGAGLERSGNRIDIRESYQLPQTCAHGLIPEWNDGMKLWQCGKDDDTTYTAGFGLALKGTTFGVVTDTVQARIGEVCGTGYTIREVTATGGVLCEPVQPIAGAGITTNGLQVAIAPSYQLPQTCATGQRPQWDDTKKVWACVDPITGLTVGPGMIGGGTSGNLQVAADPAYWQRRTSGTCTVGSAIVAVNEDGTVVCGATAPTAGTGITTSGQQVSVAVPYRLPQSCGADQRPGWDVTAVAWICADDQVNPGTITGVTAGTGLSGGGTSGNVTVSADTNYLQRRVGACGVGYSIRAIAQDGSVTCQQDTNSGGTITNISTAGGITGGGSSGSVSLNTDPNVLQRRITGACAAGSSIRVVYSDGSVSCETDTDTDTNSGGTITGVTAGSGLVGGGTSGNVTLALADNMLDLVARQGGNGTDWSAGGTTNYSNPRAKMQAGAIDVTIPANVSLTSVTITFPQAFSGTPLVIQGIEASNGQGNPQAVITALSSTSVTFEAAGASGRTYTLHWFAIGS